MRVLTFSCQYGICSRPKIVSFPILNPQKIAIKHDRFTLSICPSAARQKMQPGAKFRARVHKDCFSSNYMNLPVRHITTPLAPCFAAIAALLLLAGGPKAMAYNLEGPKWPAGSTVTFQDALGNAGRTLIDGNTSWVTAAGFDSIWNNSI